MDCPRILTREQIISYLKAGRTLNIDRCDAPELKDVLELQRQGLVTTRLIEIDDQSSVLKVKWKD
jgi:hypothetical protein